MKIDPNIVVITFVLVILVVLLSDNMTNAVLIISLITNFLFITVYFSKLTQKDDINFAEQFSSDHPMNMYGPKYTKWDSFKETIDHNNLKPHEYNYRQNVDDLNAKIGNDRMRDKRTITGAINKTADYYKYHYGSELDEEEYKPWWGRYDQ